MKMKEERHEEDGRNKVFKFELSVFSF